MPPFVRDHASVLISVTMSHSRSQREVLTSASFRRSGKTMAQPSAHFLRNQYIKQSQRCIAVMKLFLSRKGSFSHSNTGPESFHNYQSISETKRIIPARNHPKSPMFKVLQKASNYFFNSLVGYKYMMEKVPTPCRMVRCVVVLACRCLAARLGAGLASGGKRKVFDTQDSNGQGTNGVLKHDDVQFALSACCFQHTVSLRSANKPFDFSGQFKMCIFQVSIDVLLLSSRDANSCSRFQYSLCINYFFYSITKMLRQVCLECHIAIVSINRFWEPFSRLGVKFRDVKLRAYGQAEKFRW